MTQAMQTERDRLEPGTGFATVNVNSWGTSEAKRGEGFDLLVNISVQISDPKPEQVAKLWQASKDKQALYVDTVRNLVAVSRVNGAKETVTAVLVMTNPMVGNLGDILDWHYTKRPVELFDAQLRLPDKPAGDGPGHAAPSNDAEAATSHFDWPAADAPAEAEASASIAPDAPDPEAEPDPRRNEVDPPDPDGLDDIDPAIPEPEGNDGDE